jgi:GxxExxY protein
MTFDPLSHRVIGCATEVHRELGPGLLESTYQTCLAHELSLAVLRFALQPSVPVAYKGVLLECAYRLDVLVENELLLELKSVESILSIHEAQIITYLKLAKIKTGLLINFNVPILKEGIKRFVM